MCRDTGIKPKQLTVLNFTVHKFHIVLTVCIFIKSFI